MKKQTLFIIPYLICVSCFTQQHWNYNDYAKNNIENFRNNKLFNEVIDFNSIDYPRLDAAIFYVTNEMRVKNELPPLEYAPELEICAWNHSKIMVEEKFFSHTNPNNTKRETPEKRAILAGIKNPFIAENIADVFGIKYKANDPIYILDKDKGLFSYSEAGKPIEPHSYLTFAEQVVDDWMHSQGHRKNILSKDALQLGCGAYFYTDKDFYNIAKFKATQNFQLFKKIIATKPADKFPNNK